VCIDGIECIFPIEETSYTARCRLNLAWPLAYKLLREPL
jgi:hypothetical protein